MVNKDFFGKEMVNKDLYTEKIENQCFAAKSCDLIDYVRQTSLCYICYDLELNKNPQKWSGSSSFNGGGGCYR